MHHNPPLPPIGTHVCINYLLDTADETYHKWVGTFLGCSPKNPACIEVNHKESNGSLEKKHILINNILSIIHLLPPYESLMESKE